MISTQVSKISAAPKFNTIATEAIAPYDKHILKGRKKKWVELKVLWHMFHLAVKTYGSLKISIQVLKALNLFKRSTIGRTLTKIIQVQDKYYFHLFAPAYPSDIFDQYIIGEFNRIVPVQTKSDKLNYIYLAITKKCPLQCEHCFEWENLNKKESLELDDLKIIIKKFQDEGLAQFHLSGGEPMARIKDLNEIILTAEKSTEFYVLTSGFNFTATNARLLKTSGLTGIIVSLDHFIPEKHNAFRGFNNSFDQVIRAIQNAKQQNLVTGLTLCATREFLSQDNLMQYVTLAKELDVVFVQILEPKAVGHYNNKDVLLSKKDIELLDQFYETINFNPAYSQYPIIIYPGYHQRKVGCLSGANRTLYIDSEGYINACPFCHTKNFNIKEAFHIKEEFMDMVKSSKCPSVNTLNIC